MSVPPLPPVSPLPSVWVLPEAIRNRLGRDAGPQRSMLEDGHLLVIVHKMPGPDDRERLPVFFHRSPEGVWESAGTTGKGPHAMQQYFEAWETRVHALEEEEMKATTATQYHLLLESAAPVLRASRGLHRAFQQAREMVKADRELINYRDRAAALERSAELLMQDAQAGLNYTAARQSEAQAASAASMAASAHRLNILAALFLPLTALSGVLSIDPRTAFRTQPLTYWYVVGAGVLAGLLVALAVARRNRN